MKKTLIAFYFFILLAFASLALAAGIAASPGKIFMISQNKSVVEKQLRLFNPNPYDVFYNATTNSDIIKVLPENGIIAAKSAKTLTVSLEPKGKQDNKDHSARIVVSYFNSNNSHGGMLDFVTSVAINIKYKIIEEKLVYRSLGQLDKITGKLVLYNAKLGKNYIFIVLLIAAIVLGVLVYKRYKNG